MGKRIRHLEFYGFRDQNRYNSASNLDLSDLYETNDEQDKDIDELSGITEDLSEGKADIELVTTLSGKVDSFMESQEVANDRLVNAVKENADKIAKLEERDDTVTDKINEIGDSLNEVEETLSDTSAKTETLEGQMNGVLSSLTVVNDEISSITESLDSKLDKTEAEEIYARKEDVILKDDISDIITSGLTGVATEEWVLEQGYITSADSDSKYATRESVTVLEDNLNKTKTELTDQYNSLNNRVSTYVGTLSATTTVLSGRLETLESRHDREVGELKDTDSKLQSSINDNVLAIDRLEQAMDAKVDDADMAALVDRVDDLAETVDGKVGKTEFDAYSGKTAETIDNLLNNKADKGELDDLSKVVDGVISSVTQETQERKAADTEINAAINDILENIEALQDKDTNEETERLELAAKLEQEIADRKEGDNAIIGDADDTNADLTIYGTRKYAELQKGYAVSDAKAYTDTTASDLKIYVQDNVAEPLQSKIDSKADKTYVDGSISGAKDEIKSEIEDAVANEAAERKGADENLQGQIDDAVEDSKTISSCLNQVSNVVWAITDWRGENGEEYTDTGNGVLDVLHREFHDFVEHHEVPQITKDIRYDAKTESIVFEYTYNGEDRTFSLPASDLIEEWNVSQTSDGAIKLTKKRNVEGTDELSAEVVIDLSHADNVLKNNKGALYVSKNEIIDGLATSEEVVEGLSLKADKADTYTKDEVQSLLSQKANIGDVYTKEEVDDIIEDKVSESSGDISAIKALINAETQNRIASDNDIVSRLTNEIANRENADNAIKVSLSDEVGKREDADEALNDKITDLQAKIDQLRKELGETPQNENDVYTRLEVVESTIDTLIDFGTY